MRSFELYFNDLSAEAKKKYLKFQRVSDASELNADLAPLAIIDLEDDEDTCSTCQGPMKTVMNPDKVGKGLHEEKVCSDPDCESNQ